MIHFSGNPNLFVLGVDYGEYDSHCTWENFRKPILDTLQGIFREDRTKFCGRLRSDLVDRGYGVGRIHGSMWDVGRRVVRANKDRILDKRWRSGDNSKSLRAAPPGVIGIDGDVEDYIDADRDFLICSVNGHDFATLESHGSGELTTLLFNSLHNLAIGDVIFSDPQLSRMLSVKYRRVVGDDRIEIAVPKSFGSDQLTSGNYDYIAEHLVKGSWSYGHVCNPSKCILGFGFVEYRQTFCLRGVNIPRDQIMLLSSEKAKHIDDVQSLAANYATLLRTKIARGFKVKLAWYVFWFVVINHTRISLKNYALINGRLSEKSSRDDRGFVLDRTRTFLVPDVTRYLLPLSMNGCGVDMDSFLLEKTMNEELRMQ